MKDKPENTSGISRWVYIVFTAIGLYYLYFAGLGSFPLLDPDEPVYGQVAREMAHGAGWLTPHYNGGMWFDKPPMFYWLSAASASVLGTTELAVRLPSAILAVGLLLLVYALASHDFGKRVGMLSAVVMSTCFLQIWLAHGAVTDMTFVFFLTAALYGYRRWLDADGRAKYGWMALCGAMTGLAMLTKGPVAPVLLFTAFFVHLLWTKRISRLLSSDALCGVVAALVVGLPWFVAMYVMHKDTFVHDFIMVNNIARFTKAEHAGTTGKWYSYLMNIPIILAFFFPWSLFLPQAILRMRKVNDGAKLAWVWFATVFVFFSTSKTILLTYTFPLYPAAAVFVGALWASTASKDYRVTRGIRIALSIGLVVAILIAGVLVKYTHKRFPEANTAAIVFGGMLVLTLAAGLVYVLSYRRVDSSRTVLITGVGMAAISAWLACAVMPVVSPRASARDLVRQIPNAPSVRIVGYRLQKSEKRLARYPSLLFYLGRKPEDVYDAAQLERLLRGSTPVFVICKDDAAKEVLVPGARQLVKSGDLVVIANSAASLKGPGVR